MLNYKEYWQMDKYIGENRYQFRVYSSALPLFLTALIESLSKEKILANSVGVKVINTYLKSDSNEIDNLNSYPVVCVIAYLKESTSEKIQAFAYAVKNISALLKTYENGLIMGNSWMICELFALVLTRSRQLIEADSYSVELINSYIKTFSIIRVKAGSFLSEEIIGYIKTYLNELVVANPHPVKNAIANVQTLWTHKSIAGSFNTEKILAYLNNIGILVSVVSTKITNKIISLVKTTTSGKYYLRLINTLVIRSNTRTTTNEKILITKLRPRRLGEMNTFQDYSDFTSFLYIKEVNNANS